MMIVVYLAAGLALGAYASFIARAWKHNPKLFWFLWAAIILALAELVCVALTHP